LNLFPILDRVRDRIHRTRWTPERALGSRGEDLAMRFLQKQRYLIVDRNYRPRNGKGEVDLIGWDDETLAFIEVKTRASDETAAPERAVHPEKQKHIIRAAEAYTRRAKVSGDSIRFDVVTVITEGGTPTIQLYKNAFQTTAAGAWRNNPYAPAPSGSYPQA
jgi:putative endonuclease